MRPSPSRTGHAARAGPAALVVVLTVLAAAAVVTGPSAFAAEAGSVAAGGSVAGAEKSSGARKPDVRYEPTPPDVVEQMLDLAKVGPGDVVYDLGCGDGRIVIEAAKRGARGVGVDIDPERIRESRANARAAGVEDRVEFREGDLFETDVRPASVVMLFLWPTINLKLRPRLISELRPGSRVVSYWHDMGDWKPRETVDTKRAKVYLWVIDGKS